VRIPKVSVAKNKQRRNWTVKYTLDGKRVRKSRSKEAEAQVLARQFQALLDEGRDPMLEYEKQRRKEIARATTLQDFYEVFMRRHGKHQSRSTQEIYSAAMKDFHKWDYHGRRISDSPLCEINKSMVEEYRAAKLGKDGAAPATVNRYTIHVLRVFLEKAVEWDSLEKNPLTGLKPLKENNRRTVDLRPEDIGRLLEHLPEKIAPIVEWAVYTGMRKESILSLRIEQIDIQQLPEESWWVRFVQKGNRETTLKLHPFAVEVFREMKGDRNMGYLFLNSNGTRYNWIHKPFNREVERLGLKTVEGKKLCFHDLRRLFATWLAEEGFSQEEIAIALGQSSTRATSRYAQPRLTRELKLRKV
jgi:integrase